MCTLVPWNGIQGLQARPLPPSQRMAAKPKGSLLAVSGGILGCSGAVRWLQKAPRLQVLILGHG